MKTIGVIGGLGPQATMDFEQRVHKVSQQLIPPHGNSGYPPMVVYYHRYPPALTNDDMTPRLPMQPDPRLFEAVKKLGTWADFLVITSNTPHMFRAQLEEAAGLKVLSMIDTTLEEVKRRHLQKVGVVGMGRPVVYQEPLTTMGIPHTTVSDELRDRLSASIIAFMEGAEGPQGRSIAMDAISSLRAQGVDGTILACTEIPLLLAEEADEPDLINPAQLLAEAAVRYAIA